MLITSGVFAEELVNVKYPDAPSECLRLGFIYGLIRITDISQNRITN
jgi:hypothetical protein